MPRYKSRRSWRMMPISCTYLTKIGNGNNFRMKKLKLFLYYRSRSKGRNINDRICSACFITAAPEVLLSLQGPIHRGCLRKGTRRNEMLESRCRWMWSSHEKGNFNLIHIKANAISNTLLGTSQFGFTCPILTSEMKCIMLFPWESQQRS